ncbi:hypothetical protein BaRGS_00025625 [Batillaria attramentaria]|uniref:J domain-containing protein n=1 Tax=Batillaria attramentaria TaxID=370345 RepID=A0ABD0K708_9CAEN
MDDHFREKAKCLEILGLEASASDDDIKRAYRAQALKYHPDKNKSEDATERFQEIQYAYKYLQEGPSLLQHHYDDSSDDEDGIPRFHNNITSMDDLRIRGLVLRDHRTFLIRLATTILPMMKMMRLHFTASGAHQQQVLQQEVEVEGLQGQLVPQPQAEHPAARPAPTAAAAANASDRNASSTDNFPTMSSSNWGKKNGASNGSSAKAPADSSTPASASTSNTSQASAAQESEEKDKASANKRSHSSDSQAKKSSDETSDSKGASADTQPSKPAKKSKQQLREEQRKRDEEAAQIAKELEEKMRLDKERKARKEAARLEKERQEEEKRKQQEEEEIARMAEKLREEERRKEEEAAKKAKEQEEERERQRLLAEFESGIFMDATGDFLTKDTTGVGNIKMKTVNYTSSGYDTQDWNTGEMPGFQQARGSFRGGRGRGRGGRGRGGQGQGPFQGRPPYADTDGPSMSFGPENLQQPPPQHPFSGGSHMPFSAPGAGVPPGFSAPPPGRGGYGFPGNRGNSHTNVRGAYSGPGGAPPGFRPQGRGGSGYPGNSSSYPGNSHASQQRASNGGATQEFGNSSFSGAQRGHIPNRAAGSPRDTQTFANSNMSQNSSLSPGGSGLTRSWADEVSDEIFSQQGGQFSPSGHSSRSSVSPETRYEDASRNSQPRQGPGPSRGAFNSWATPPKPLNRPGFPFPTGHPPMQGGPGPNPYFRGPAPMPSSNMPPQPHPMSPHSAPSPTSPDQRPRPSFTSPPPNFSPPKPNMEPGLFAGPNQPRFLVPPRPPTQWMTGVNPPAGFGVRPGGVTLQRPSIPPFGNKNDAEAKNFPPRMPVPVSTGGRSRYNELDDIDD